MEHNQDHFPFRNSWFLGFMLIFQGVCSSTLCINDHSEKDSLYLCGEQQRNIIIVTIYKLNRLYIGSLHSQTLNVWGIYLYIYPLNYPNVGKYTIHWVFGIHHPYMFLGINKKSNLEKIKHSQKTLPVKNNGNTPFRWKSPACQLYMELWAKMHVFNWGYFTPISVKQ